MGIAELPDPGPSSEGGTRSPSHITRFGVLRKASFLRMAPKADVLGIFMALLPCLVPIIFAEEQGRSHAPEDALYSMDEGNAF